VTAADKLAVEERELIEDMKVVEAELKRYENNGLVGSLDKGMPNMVSFWDVSSLIACLLPSLTKYTTSR